MATTHATLTSESVLVNAACRGDEKAFEDLYRRHSQAAWRIAQAVTHNADDAADAVAEAFTRVFAAMLRGSFRSDAPFRPYLLTTTRNAAIDHLRQAGRTLVTDSEDLDLRDERTPATKHDQDADADMVSAAFRTLPERWRSVLWLTEVEGLPPRKAADVLGLSANSTSQLAVRARAGLRERYLQAHLRATDDLECRRTVGHLGAYVAGSLPARDIAKVDQHLMDCADCRERLSDLDEVGGRLKLLALPLPLTLGLAAKSGWAASLASASHAGPLGLSIPGIRQLSPWAERAIAGAAAAVVTLGIVGATIYGSRDHANLDTNRPTARAEQGVGAPLSDLGLDLTGATAPTLSSGAGSLGGGLSDLPTSPTTVLPTRGPISTIPANGGNGSPPVTIPSIGGGAGGGAVPTDPGAAAAAPPVQVQAGVTVGDQSVAVSVAPVDGCTGVQAAGTVIGCDPADAPAATGAQVEVGGGALPLDPVKIGL